MSGSVMTWVRRASGIAVAAALLWAPAPAALAVNAGSAVTFDFGNQRLGTTSAAETVTIPRTILLSDLPAAGVVYGGGDATTNTLLGLAGLPVPLTWGDLAEKYDGAGIVYDIDTSTLQTGTQFHATTLECGATAGSDCTRSVTFHPTAAGALADSLDTTVDSVAVSGGGITGAIASLLAPFVGASVVEPYLALGLTGTGVRPHVTDRTPASDATGVPRDVRPTVTFTRTMDPGTIDLGSLTLSDLTVPAAVAGTLSWDAGASKATIKPSTLLAAGHTFRISADPSIKDDNGIALDGTNWSFTVASDATPPTITARVPAPNATNAGRTANVVVTFGEALRPSTVSGRSVRLVDVGTGKAVKASVVWQAAARRIRLDPAAALKARHAYRVVLSASIRDVAGNPLPATSWTFRTKG